ncbi:DUF4097 family beta strand repeat-containing protein [Actinoplanes sp. NPDC051343]|uniref:DUF4097 family beta strand repeat-containing protein n=1 Tax=Actinoplanes sp. NPDC051343 TaxID=3363906 RepID=UPI0037B817E0
MLVYDTPAPISVSLGLGFAAATVHVVAEARGDTEVDVRPAKAGRSADRKIAEQTVVEFADGVLSLRAPKVGVVGRHGAIDVTLKLPEGSAVHGETGMGEVTSRGRLGEFRFVSGYGDIRVDDASVLRVESSSGDLAVGRADRAEIVVRDGTVQVEVADGPVTAETSNGDIQIGEARGEVRATSENGRVEVGRALGDVIARTVNGNIRIGEARGGEVRLDSSDGSLDIGLAEGVAARLDLDTTGGRLRNELTNSPAPAAGSGTISVRMRTSNGDIVVRRAG